MTDWCGKCFGDIKRSIYKQKNNSIICVKCKKQYHVKCIGITILDTEAIKTLKESWKCNDCIEKQFIRENSSELNFGQIMCLSYITVHYYCLLMASYIKQRGNDDEGILGFLPADIYKIVQQGKKTICTYCKLRGATVYCCVRKCRIVFHLACGILKGTFHQFFGTFKSYCHLHRLRQKVPIAYIKTELQCLVCLNKVYGYVRNDTLWSPCCKNAWFHRVCIQKLALSTGYFFKCPLCNNADQFVDAMQKYGIYIPLRDASWELEENAFQDLSSTYSHCDAVTCCCPKGRSYNDNNNQSFWHLMICVTCGSQGCHKKCLNQTSDLSWECKDCQEITHKDKPKKRGRKRKLNRKTYNQEIHSLSNISEEFANSCVINSNDSSSETMNSEKSVTRNMVDNEIQIISLKDFLALGYLTERTFAVQDESESHLHDFREDLLNEYYNKESYFDSFAEDKNEKEIHEKGNTVNKLNSVPVFPGTSREIPRVIKTSNKIIKVDLCKKNRLVSTKENNTKTNNESEIIDLTIDTEMINEDQTVQLNNPKYIDVIEISD